MQVQMVHLGDVGIVVPIDENSFTTHVVTKPCEIGGQLPTEWSICGMPQFSRVTIKNSGAERADQRFQTRRVVDSRSAMAQMKIRKDEDGVGRSQRHTVVPITETTTDRAEPRARCSYKNRPCQVPNRIWPAVTGIDSDVRVSAIRRWLGISSGPSRV